MFFCGTIYSTIGYGHPSPISPGGRVFTCLYALVGIPLFLVILKEVPRSPLSPPSLPSPLSYLAPLPPPSFAS